jgi:hypothetical protein
MHLKTYSTTRTIKETVDIATGIIIKTKVLNDKTPVKTILEGLGVIFDSNGNSRYYSKVLRYIKKGVHIPAQRERSYWPSVNAYSGLTVNNHTGFSVNDFC